MELKPGYKQTEVGLIPRGWEARPLFGAVKPATGQVSPRQEPYRSMILVAPDHIEGETGRLLERNTAAAQGAISGKFLFNPGDVVYSKIRPYLRKVIVAEFQGLCSADMYPLTPAKDVCSRFILAVLLGHHFSCFATTVSARSGIPKINREELAQYTIALPPLHEQRAIAAALSDVDTLIGGLEKLIAKKRDLKQAAMQQLLTGQTRLLGFGGANRRYKHTDLGVIPEEWGVTKIRDAASIKTGKRNTQDRIEDGQYPFFVRSQSVERIDSYSFDGEAVLTAGDGVGTGKVFHYIKGKFDFHQRVYKISDFSAELNGFYFFLYFSSQFYDRIMAMTAKSSVDSVRLETIAGMPIPLPSPDEQAAIATVFSDMDAEIAALEQRRDKTRALKQGMMQELLTGKTRLV